MNIVIVKKQIIKAVSENEGKDIGLYYRDRLDFEAERDRKERSGEIETILIDRDKALEIAERAAGRKIDDLQIISTKDPNIKEIVGADAIAGRAYHVGNGKIVIVADNIGDYAKAMGTIAEEGRHIYHRNNNGLEDSEDYASFYGRQFERYYDRNFGNNDVAFITERLKYTKEQLGNDWENDASIFYHVPYKGMADFGHVSIEVDGTVYSFGRYGKTWGVFKSKGEAVLLKVNRDTYFKNYSQLQDVIEYKLNLTENEEEKIKKFFENLPKTGKTRKVENAKTKVVLDSQGSVLMGEYSLLGRNCTTMTIVSLNNSAKNIHIPVIVSPAELKSYLNTRYDAEKNNKIQLETQYSRTPEKLERKIIKGVITHKKKK